jgi:hypothetical protein
VNGTRQATGLRRFVRPPGQPAEMPAPSISVPPEVAHILESAPKGAPGERCEMCNVTIPEEHSHVVQIEQRQLMCTCRPCALLFTDRAAGNGKFASVPDRYLYDPEPDLSDASWEALQIPVHMAFFFVNSKLDGKTVAFYPSPAGATESDLASEGFDEFMSDTPLFGQLEPDVEALLIYRLSPKVGHDIDEIFLAPIDACYELVGLVRSHWRGFDGGQELWEAVEVFFAGLRNRSRPFEPAPR